jgi:zinc transport system ATP-binding protein
MKTSEISKKPSHAHRQLLIDVDNLTVRLGNETALDNVSFCVHAGEFIGLIGPNGAGKTTLLRAMLGLQKPDEGHIAEINHTISYIPQHGNLYNGSVPMSVIEVVKLGSAGSKELALDALNQVGLEGVAKRRFSDLSGGQRQRVAIAKALASNPDILILDEPTTGIDEHSQAEFYETLHRLHQKNITIITVAHEVDTLLKQAGRVICLNRTIQYDGPAADFDPNKHMPSFYKEQHQLHHHGAHHA